MVTCLNKPPGKKKKKGRPPSGPLRRSSLVVQRLVQFWLKSCVQVRLKPSLLYSGLYSFWLKSCVQVRLKPSLNPILPNP